MSDESTQPDPLDPTDAKLVERQHNEKALKGHKRLMADLKNLLATPGGRRVAWWLLEQSRMFVREFRVDPCQNAHCQGFHYMGLVIRENLVEADFEGYQLMERENHNMQR